MCDDKDNQSAKPPTSERKLAANRANAQRSTGPRTPQGKTHARLNALKHGLLSKRLIYSNDGQLAHPDLYQLREGLLDHYGRNDIRVLMLIDAVILETWHQQRGLRSEMALANIADKKEFPSSEFAVNEHMMSNLRRYGTTSQNALFRLLKTLDTMLGQRPKDEDLPDSLALAADFNEAEADGHHVVEPAKTNPMVESPPAIADAAAADSGGDLEVVPLNPRDDRPEPLIARTQPPDTQVGNRMRRGR
jgi:hypothetical protein